VRDKGVWVVRGDRGVGEIRSLVLLYLLSADYFALLLLVFIKFVCIGLWDMEFGNIGGY
jgi:hypothetical protein